MKETGRGGRRRKAEDHRYVALAITVPPGFKARLRPYVKHPTGFSGVVREFCEAELKRRAEPEDAT